MHASKISLHVVQRAAYLHVRLDGTVRAGDGLALSRHLLQHRGLEPRHMLVDLRTGEVDVEYGEIMNLARWLRPLLAGLEVRVALLDRWNDGFNRTQFFEHEALRHGLSVKAFIDFEEAIKWMQVYETLEL